MENTLKESLMLAQRSADETRANAHREAELILQEARQQAEQIRREAEQRIQSLLREIETLEARKRAALLELRTLLLTHLQALEPTALDVEHAATELSSERDAVEEPTPL
jgi:cell division initiation protein